MMNKTKSKKISAIRFLLLLPLLCILLLSFRNKLEILPTIKTGFTKAISAFKTSESLRVNKTHIPIKKLLKRYVTLGIVIDDATLQPIAGITVREIKYGLETKTDARGIYKITITDTSSKVDYTFKMSKEGLPYISEQSGSYSNQSDKDETGAIMISSIRTKSIVDLKAGLVNSSSYFSVEPTYENLNNSIALFVKHRENEAALKLANDKNERIFEVKDNQAFILRANGTPYASIDGISPLILIEGKMLTGEELNAIYKRSQFKVKTIRVNDSQSAKKKYNTQYGVFEIELEK